MARTTSYTRDPTTGKWEKSKSNVSKSNSSKQSSNSSGKSTTSKSPSSSSSGSKENQSKDDGKDTSKKKSPGKSKRKQNKKEYYTLSGEVSIVPGKQTIKIKAGDTVKMKGIGKYLTGNYYVQDVTRKIDQSGYSQSMTLLKPNFSSTMKKLRTKKKKKGGKKKK